MCGSPAVLLDVPGFEEAHGFPPLDAACECSTAGFHELPDPPPEGLRDTFTAMSLEDMLRGFEPPLAPGC